jgi:transposase
MTQKMTIKTYPTAFKVAAIRRIEAGEAVLHVSRDLEVSRKLLHDWKKAWGLKGLSGLNAKRGPKPGPKLMRHLVEVAPKGNLGELVQARARIAELERKIGQQAIDIDFFQRALRVLKMPDVQGKPMKEGKLAPTSRKLSKP